MRPSSLIIFHLFWAFGIVGFGSVSRSEVPRVNKTQPTAASLLQKAREPSHTTSTLPSTSPIPSSLASPTASPSASPSSLVSPIASPLVSPRASPSPVSKVLKMTSDKVIPLREEFFKAQQSERLALQHRQEMELQELEISQQSIRKNWEQQQKEEKRRIFQSSLAANQRLQYDQETRKKREALAKLMSQDRKIRMQEQQETVQEMNITQKRNREKFEEFLKRLEQPPPELWPR